MMERKRSRTAASPFAAFGIAMPPVNGRDENTALPIYKGRGGPGAAAPATARGRNRAKEIHKIKTTLDLFRRLL